MIALVYGLRIAVELKRIRDSCSKLEVYGPLNVGRIINIFIFEVCSQHVA